MGCLKRIFSIIILIFAYIGFQSVGGVKFCQDFISNIGKSNTEKILPTDNDFDTSSLGDDFEISKSLSFAGVKYIEADYEKAPQKIFIIDSNGFIKITKEDFESGKIDSILQDTISKFSYMAIRIENPRIIRSSKFRAVGQDIPYVIFKADVIRGKIPQMIGMIGVMDDKDGKNSIIFSYKTTGDYDQEVTEKFFQRLKPSKEL
jgi:hypothetical protein